MSSSSASGESTEARRRNRFTRRPWRTSIGLLLLILLALELILRLMPLPLLDFAFQARQVYRYHDSWYTDFRPGHRARLTLPGDDGAPVLDFVLEVDERGFRSGDPDDDGPEARLIHAIGDSFTMGWGVDGEDAYPARLDRLLGAEVDVLNLGLNGFGALGATEKSAELFAALPPDTVVYLATENDYDDDQHALRHAGRPSWLRRIFDLSDAFRRRSLVGSLPFAGRWALQLARLEPPPPALPTAPAPRVRVLDDDPLSPHRMHWGVASKQALRRYVDGLPAETRMFVFTHGDGPVVRDVASFCRTLGLPVVRLRFDPGLLIPRDGHLTIEGNRRLAEVIADHIDEPHR